jgi:hypothetical protein
VPVSEDVDRDRHRFTDGPLDGKPSRIDLRLQALDDDAAAAVERTLAVALAALDDRR